MRVGVSSSSRSVQQMQPFCSSIIFSSCWGEADGEAEAEGDAEGGSEAEAEVEAGGSTHLLLLLQHAAAAHLVRARARARIRRHANTDPPGPPPNRAYGTSSASTFTDAMSFTITASR